jgi:hypothetical protein
MMKSCDIGEVRGFVGLPKSGNPTYAAFSEKIEPKSLGLS